MANDLSIILKSKLDQSAKAVGDLNKQIKEIESKLKEIKLKVNFDSKNINSNVKSKMKDVETTVKNTSKKIKIFDENQLNKDFIGVKDIVNRIQKTFSKLGDTKIAIGKNAKGEIQSVTAEVTKANGVIEKFKYNLGEIQKGGRKYAGFVSGGSKVTDNTAQIAERQLQAAQKTNSAIEKQNQSRIRAENKINEIQERNLRNREAREAQATQRESQRRQRLESSTNERWQRNLIQREAREAQVARRTAQVATNTSNQLGLFQQQQNLRATSLTGGAAGRFVDNTALEQFRRSVASLTRDTPNLRNRMAELRLEFQRINSSAQNASRSSLNLGESIRQAAIKFPLWMGIATVFMQITNQVRDSIKYIYDMDTALTELSKVTDFSAERLDNMRQSALELGKQLGHSSVDVMKSMAEFGRVTKDPEAIKQLAKTATMASNVTSMTAQEAAKALNSTMISFKMNATDSMKILDQWNEIQNNFRVSAEDLADSIGKVGAAAGQAGVKIEELEGYTAAIVSATGITGSESGTALKFRGLAA